MSRLGHSARCRCGDCGIEATRRRIAEMECELLLCDCTEAEHWYRNHPTAHLLRNVSNAHEVMLRAVRNPGARATTPVQPRPNPPAAKARPERFMR